MSAMPKIDIDALKVDTYTGYPEPFRQAVRGGHARAGDQLFGEADDVAGIVHRKRGRRGAAR